jgi:hypothetical protein
MWECYTINQCLAVIAFLLLLIWNDSSGVFFCDYHVCINIISLMTARRERTRLVIVYCFYKKRVKQCFVFSLWNKCDNCIDSSDQLSFLLLYLSVSSVCTRNYSIVCHSCNSSTKRCWFVQHHRSKPLDTVLKTHSIIRK